MSESRVPTPTDVSFGTPQTRAKKPAFLGFFCLDLKVRTPEREPRWATHPR
jgi:hypothetical protein